MSDDQPRYVSYLLRLWQVKTRQGWNWQASLESPATGKLQGFQTVDSLVAFLHNQTQHETFFEQIRAGESLGSDDVEG
jgi:hypothetical protein